MLVEKYRLINIYSDRGMYFFVGSQFVTSDLQMIRREIDLKWNNYKSIV
jgi:hypothetical protein